MDVQPGRVVILDGPPRSGKSSIAAAMQREIGGDWIALGVDSSRATTPPHLQPGIGLRPGGERPDLEPVVAVLFQALYASVAAHSRLGLDVVVDVAHHDDYASGLDTRAIASAELAGLPVLLVRVSCPLEEIRRRRLRTWGDDGRTSGPGGADAAAAWEAALSVRAHDLVLDTSELTASACAAAIAARLGSEDRRPVSPR